jgi:hypothetical protein
MQLVNSVERLERRGSDMEDEYLFTLEEMRTALKMGVEAALMVLAKSSTSTTDELKLTSDNVLKLISESFLKKAA